MKPVSIDDLRRAREEFLRSSTGQRSRRAWATHKSPPMTVKQAKYLLSLLRWIESEVSEGHISVTDAMTLLDSYRGDLSIGEAGAMIDKARKLLGQD